MGPLPTSLDLLLKAVGKHYSSTTEVIVSLGMASKSESKTFPTVALLFPEILRPWEPQLEVARALNKPTGDRGNNQLHTWRLGPVCNRCESASVTPTHFLVGTGSPGVVSGAPDLGS